ncbi:NUDIX hydrolase [candidate division KSB1 bacterium]|nr:NUDIX hydrolase [candidate division KSB1 bacterium]
MKTTNEINIPTYSSSDLPDGKNPFETIDSHNLGQPPATWYPIRIDTVRNLLTGNSFHYTVSEIGPSVAIVAMDDDGYIFLVGQWRYTFGKYSWELPSGSAADKENLRDAAKRELREETGLIADSWTKLGTVDNCNGATIDEGHLFLATNLALFPATPDPNEIIQRVRIPFSEAVSLVFSNRITESLSIAAILKAKHLLNL